MSTTSAETHTIRSGGESNEPHLVATLRRVGDRFLQQIEFVPGDVESRRILLLESFDGDPLEPWPASPPLQACQTEATIGILATGMAGTTHWSLALTPAEDALTWDIACRFKKVPSQLAAMYRSHVDLTPTPNNTGWDLALPGQYKARMTASRDSQTETEISHREQKIVFSPTTVADPPVTVRWLYRLHLIGPTGIGPSE